MPPETLNILQGVRDEQHVFVFGSYALKRLK
jgi:hypothetical protein